MSGKMKMKKTFNYFFIILVEGKDMDIYESEPLSLAHGAAKWGDGGKMIGEVTRILTWITQ